tara:strand:- start:3924 stop:4604 length:681 start_codon:yes stop_codon:yes gene_type:complete
MAIPTSGYPTTLDDTNATPSATVEFPQPASATDLDATNVEHDLLHKNLSLSIVALQTKLGITDSNPTSGTILQGTGSGSAWSSTLPAVTLGGAVTGGDQVMSAVTHKDYSETVYAGGNTGATPAIDEANGNTQSHTLNAATVTFALPADAGLQAGTALTLILSQDGSGSRAGVFQVSGATTNVKWAGGTAPTLTTTASRADIIAFVTFNGGASPVWYGFVAGQDFQ